MPSWNATQYLKYEKERTQPAIDLAAKIPLESPKKILDVGCGPGNSTQILKNRYPNADIMGIDSSPDMIDTARQSDDLIRFECFDASGDLTGLGTGYDVVFSNACIQWVPDHHRLIPNLLQLLAPGGVLAVQTPMNYREPIHTIIEQVAKQEPWEKYMRQPRVFHNLPANDYYDILSGHASGFTLWETVYYHILKSHNEIMEWYRGTGLRPYLEALPDELRNSFEAEVLSEVAKAYPLQQNGHVIFRFPRFFFVAEK